MEIRLLTTPGELSAYDLWVKHHPQGSLWQSIEWKGYQEAFGRQTRVYGAMEGSQILASALVIIDRTAGGFCTWDIPRGPLALGMENEKWKMGNEWKPFLDRIILSAQREKCLSLFLSPPAPFSIFNFQFSIRPSGRHEQPEATRILDLTQPEEALLAQMHQKGRYNIKVAEKHGVRVEESKDIDAFYALLKETGGRDAFGIKPKTHYEAFLKELPGSFLLLAYAAQNDSVRPSPGTGVGMGANSPGYKEALAGLLGIIWNGTGVYYYGASSYAHRALMAPYLLQWEAMKRCKALGCVSYDLLGISPPGAPQSHPWTGVSAFKEKFGGTVVTYPPEQQIVLRPVLNSLLGLKRKFFG
ncbi:MAG: peptidoglycan bridge formation glycyltransferase FemA/FemB family protein [Candidatus Peribacteraceae bacterium]|jgi:lipid II:glycine glycyltransferase (peptidoglycan interpeptide bridge formation enzyme)